MRNEYATKTIVQIDPYIVADPMTTGSKAKIGEGDMPPVCRNYQYLYTGQNIDVREFDLDFNLAWAQVIQGQGTGNKATEDVKIDSEKGIIIESTDHSGGSVTPTGTTESLISNFSSSKNKTS